jgi:hypothetical protein
MAEFSRRKEEKKSRKNDWKREKLKK